jgi:hypothetical protein
VSGRWRVLVAVVVLGLAAGSVRSAEGQAKGHGDPSAIHTDPLNLDPLVRQGYEKFYNLDYDGALGFFNKVTQAHPNEPMAWNYVLLATLFRELYHQDLLDTTYYAHDSFLSNKRTIQIPAATRKQIDDLTDKVVAMCDARISANGQDKNAYFARGYAKGMHAVFLTLVDHAFASAAPQGYQSRNDSEAVLKIDPQYADAEMAVGIQQFAVASLPRWVRMIVGIMGVGGNKQAGLDKLKDAAAHGTVTGIESRTALSLFLRHDARYAEALQWQRGLAEQFPHDYLFQLEAANLLKDSGEGNEAIAAYKHVLDQAKTPGYFVDPRLQMAWFGLADTQRGYNDIRGAANGYLQAAEQPNCSDWLRKRAQLNAGEMDDLLGDRAGAVRMYQMAAASGGDQSQAEAAKRYLKTPFVGK